ncbi:MAG: hypothetical protein M3252_08245 [Actinomycetota bacterium]|nr:hypothetical protein [Actinomycetota bacterium]
MSPLSRRSGEEEERATTRLNLDLEERVCALCRRDLPAWAELCQCGGMAVRRVDLPPQDDPLLDRLLTEDDPEGGA